MGLIALILSFTRTERNGAKVSDVKCDPGGGPNITAEHYGPAGDDSHPLLTDYPYIAPTAQRGRYVAVGYIDPKSEPKAQPGEKRIYARDEAGAVVCEVWLKADGTGTLVNSKGAVTLGATGSILGENEKGSFTLRDDGSHRLENANGYAELKTDGSHEFTGGAKITTGGDFVSGSGVSLDGHPHIGNMGTETSPPIPG